MGCYNDNRLSCVECDFWRKHINHGDIHCFRRSSIVDDDCEIGGQIIPTHSIWRSLDDFQVGRVVGLEKREKEKKKEYEPSQTILK